jgi:uncharacterized protein
MKNTTDAPTEPPFILYEPPSARTGEGQCDCACVATIPLEPPTTAVAPPNASPYVLQNPFTAIPVVPHRHVIVNDYTSAVVVNESTLTMARHFHNPRPLTDWPDSWSAAWGETAVRHILTQLVTLKLLAPAHVPTPPLAEAATTLSAWLHVTDRCNLRCPYCYLPHRREDLSPANGRAAIAATFRSAIAHHYQSVKLKYAGGEPFIRFPFIVELHQYAQSLAAQHNLALDGVILSNGTLLTAEAIQTMRALGLRLMISLDGLGEAHDSQRPYANGRGSFDDVLDGINLAQENGLTPDISITVSGRNAAELPTLLRWILDRDLPFSLNFYRENDRSATHDGLRLEEAQIIAGMQAAFAEIEANLPQRSLLASLVDRANLATPHQRTCGVGHSYLVFDQHGRASKCQMHQSQPITDVHAADPLALIRADQISLQNPAVQEKEGCRDCEWKNWCAGGCPLVTYRATGRYDVQSPNCHIYKTLYPAALRLEGLRLLRQNLPQ